MLTRIAPILAVAYWVSTHSAQFGAQMPTRSPLPMPASSSPGQRVHVCGELGVAPPPHGVRVRSVDERLALAEGGHRGIEVRADGVAEQRRHGRSGGVAQIPGHACSPPLVFSGILTRGGCACDSGCWMSPWTAGTCACSCGAPAGR